MSVLRYIVLYSLEHKQVLEQSCCLSHMSVGVSVCLTVSVRGVNCGKNG